MHGRQNLQAVLDSLNEGILTLDDEGNVADINRAACEILEIDRLEALRRNCPCLLGDEACGTGSLLIQSIAQRRPIRDYEVRIATVGGRQKTIRLRTTVLRDGRDRPRGGVVVFQDVTELHELRRDLGSRYQLHNLVGRSTQMQTVFELIEQVWDSDATVLVEGETGTGKELVARAIHYGGPRASGPFVTVNCAALPASLIQSELFGHIRGAFTGADRDQQGRFEAARGGTILLDEIGDMPLDTQVELLRVLEERTIQRVGDAIPIPVDIRVIAATNQPLRQLVAQGRFRDDLYYRLRVVPIMLPPLRERREDILLLTRRFVGRLRRRTGRPIEGIDAEAESVLLDYAWPGNVRELENAMEFAFVKTKSGVIGLEHLPPELHEQPLQPAPTAEANLPDDPILGRRPELTADRVAATLSRANGNVAKAARRLGISRTTVYKKIREFSLPRGREQT